MLVSLCSRLEYIGSCPHDFDSGTPHLMANSLVLSSLCGWAQ